MGCMDKGGSKQTSTSYTPEQAKYLGQALELYGGELGKGANIYPGTRVAPLAGLQTEALTGAGKFADYFSTPQTISTPLFDQTGKTTERLLTGEMGAQPLTGAQVQDYFQGAIYDPTMTSLKEDILPMVDESYAGPGFFGSARSKAREETIKDVGQWLGEERAGLEWDVAQRNQALKESAADRALSALSPAMAYGEVPAREIQNNLAIASQQLGGLGELFGFGQAEQTQEQAELQDAIMRFAEENQLTDPTSLAILMNLLGMKYSTSVSTGEPAGLLGTWEGLGRAGGALAGTLEGLGF